MMGDEVTKLVILIKEQIIQVGHMETDGTVEDDNVRVLREANKSGELTDNGLLVFQKFSVVVRVCDEHGNLCYRKINGPFAMHVD